MAQCVGKYWYKVALRLRWLTPFFLNLSIPSGGNVLPKRRATLPRLVAFWRNHFTFGFLRSNFSISSWIVVGTAFANFQMMPLLPGVAHQTCLTTMKSKKSRKHVPFRQIGWQRPVILGAG